MAERVEPRTLQGTMELLPPDQILFNRMYDTIRGVYESFGFLPLDGIGIHRIWYVGGRWRPPRRS